MHAQINGFRFIARGKTMKWEHWATVQPDDIDCTDMDDQQLQEQVCRTVGIFRFALLTA